MQNQAEFDSPLAGLDQMVDLSSAPEGLSDWLVSVRRHLHKHPEIGLQEIETSRFIRRALETNGLEVHGPIARTGLYVDIVGERPGPMIAYRADMDALPIQDAKEVPYASSVQEISHMCGHDVHTTMAIGVALLLSGLRHLMHGSVRVFFQPNEEGIPSGAPLMVRDGVMEGVSAVYASHVDPTLSVGTYGLIEGPVTASADRFRVAVLAPSTGHSARPHQSIDTIWIATQIMGALYHMIGRVSDARNGAVLSICRFQAGEAYNVLPAMAEFGGTYRCMEHDDRGLFKKHIINTATQTAALHGAQVEIDFEFGSPPVMNDENLVKIVRDTILETVGPEAIFDIPRPSMGAEDFAHYLDLVPGMLLRVGTASGPETAHILHDSMFDIDEASLAATARLMADVLLRTLRERKNGAA